MVRCPKCGLDVSPALRICTSCQTRLDGTSEDTTPKPPATFAFDRSVMLMTAAVVALTLWPMIARWWRLDLVTTALGWVGAALVAGAVANSMRSQRVAKKITAPAFGELETSNWKKGEGCYWTGRYVSLESEPAIEIGVYCTDTGPSAEQRALFERMIDDLPDLKTTGISALRALDCGDWPEAARGGTFHLVALQLEDDEDTREDTFSLRFASASDPEAEYYVDFRNGKVEEAYRLG